MNFLSLSKKTCFCYRCCYFSLAPTRCTPGWEACDTPDRGFKKQGGYFLGITDLYGVPHSRVLRHRPKSLRAWKWWNSTKYELKMASVKWRARSIYIFGFICFAVVKDECGVVARDLLLPMPDGSFHVEGLHFLWQCYLSPSAKGENLYSWRQEGTGHIWPCVFLPLQSP